jgi:hypothetical protein
MADFIPKTDKQAEFVKEARENLAQGKDLNTAAKEAAVAVYDTKYEAARLLKNATIRAGLGLDDPEVKSAYESLVLGGLEDARNGVFPEWLGSDPKLKLDFYKTHFNKAGDALITKTERHINEDGDFAGKSSHELEFFKNNGRWPDTIPGKPEDIN